MKHPDFSLVDLPKEALYAYEVVKFAAPFATVAGLAITAYSAWWEAREKERFEKKLFAKLDAIHEEVVKTGEMLKNQLYDTVVKERAGEVNAMAELLSEYRSFKSRGILDNGLTQSLDTKNKIMQYLDDPNLPLDYFHIYNGLYIALLSTRVSFMGLYTAPAEDIDAEVQPEDIDAEVQLELKDKLKYEKDGVEAAKKIGALRVSYETKEFWIDTVPPSTSLHATVKVDGKL